MNIFNDMVGKSFEEQVRLFRKWMDEERYGLWHMTPEMKEQHRVWVEKFGPNAITKELRRIEAESTVAANKEYNDNKDNIHGPYAGGRQW